MTGMMNYVRESKAHVFVDSLDSHVLINGEDFHHLARVLRIKMGEHVTAACDRSVREYEVVTISKDQIELRATRDVDVREEVDVHLAVGLFKIDRLEWGIQKAIEAGATRITVGPSQRSSLKLNEKQLDKFVTRISTIARNASMQSRRCQLTKIEYVDDLIEYCTSAAMPLVVCDPQGDTSCSQEGIIVIGPEGGLSETERDALCAHGTMWNLSPYILRAETALACAPALFLQAR